ncbi:MAG: hypothetical protein AAAFM81_01470 [Pseudomonadota bacterium]
MRHLGLMTLFLTILAFGGAPLHADTKNEKAAPKVLVNGKALTHQQVDSLTQMYGQVIPGKYWYDPVSGLYGNIGGAPMGQLYPSMTIGGPLAANASGGGNGRLTGVFINGREIHPLEYMFYQQLFGTVWPGRYWMNAQGVGGFVGMPASFNVQAAMAQARASSQRGRGNGGGNGSVYMPWIGGKPGTSVGKASDGCVYIVQGDYSAESC